MACKKKHIWLTLFAATAIAITVSITAFFTETEYSANTFTVGKVDTINEHFNNEFDKMHKNDLAG